MKAAATSFALAFASISLAIPVAHADNPLLASSTPATVLTDQQLDKVKGTGVLSRYYGYWGNYYAGTAVQYGSLGNYYDYLGTNYTGSGGTATNDYYSAYLYAGYARDNYYSAYSNALSNR